MKKQSIDFEALGIDQKYYENIYAGAQLVPQVPVIARLDGRAFHTLTRKAQKPFDDALIYTMMETTSVLVEEFCPDIGYQQSDEITLVWSDIGDMFNGRIQKLCSVFASMATSIFVKAAQAHDFEYDVEYPSFDCRVWHVPDMNIAARNLMWREWDASKNSISMCAHSMLSDAELLNVSSKDRIELMHQKGFEWNDLEDYKKRGSYWQRREFLEMLSPDELAKIPEAYRPKGPVGRTRVVMIDIPRLTQIENKVEVLFHRAEPVFYHESDKCSIS